MTLIVAQETHVMLRTSVCRGLNVLLPVVLVIFVMSQPTSAIQIMDSVMMTPIVVQASVILLLGAAPVRTTSIAIVTLVSPVRLRTLMWADSPSLLVCTVATRV